MKNFLFLVFIVAVLVSCTSEKKNPLEGKTYELLSAKWYENDSLFTFPATNTDKAISMFGKSHTVAIWQDLSREEATFFLGHEYELEDDSLNLTIKYWYSDPTRYVGKTLKVKYEIYGDTLKIEGIFPDSKNKNQVGNEIWLRID